ncbi:hypothetical protein [Dactylosporangium sp. NPDC048998]
MTTAILRRWYGDLARHLLLWVACFSQAVRRDLQFRSQTAEVR